MYRWWRYSRLALMVPLVESSALLALRAAQVWAGLV